MGVCVNKHTKLYYTSLSMIIAWLKTTFFIAVDIFLFLRKNLNSTFYVFLTSINFFIFLTYPKLIVLMTFELITTWCIKWNKRGKITVFSILYIANVTTKRLQCIHKICSLTNYAYALTKNRMQNLNITRTYEFCIVVFYFSILLILPHTFLFISLR